MIMLMGMDCYSGESVHGDNVQDCCWLLCSRNIGT